MQVCKKAAFLALVLLTFTAESGFSETSSSVSDMPSVTMPAAPKMPQMPAAPSVGNFYVPGFKNQQAKNKKAEAADGDKSSGQTETGSNDSSQADEAKNLAESLAGKNLLTATDITSLYDSGLFDSLSSIAGRSSLSGAGTAASLSGGSQGQGASENALLKKILDRLKEMKKSQEDLSPEKQQELAAYQKDSKLFKTRDPKILRFRINGYNIADSVSSAFFSETEADGTFLLTGDRTYYADGRARNETFYLLFKAVKSNGAAVTFDVQPSLVQDFENQNSFVYRFSKLTGLRAEKTGNLVALHTVTDDLNVDLLLDVDSDR